MITQRQQIKKHGNGVIILITILSVKCSHKTISTIKPFHVPVRIHSNKAAPGTIIG